MAPLSVVARPFGLVFRPIIALPNPIPLRGALGWPRVPEEHHAALDAAVASHR